MDSGLDSGQDDCDVQPGQRIWLTAGTADWLRDCRIPVGVIFSFPYNEDRMPETETPVAPADQPIPTPAGNAAAAPVAPVEAPVAPVVAAPAHAQAVPTEALTEAPGGQPDLSQLEGLAGDNPVLMVVLALVVVGGGTAGWKFWNKLSEQKHEQAMKKMEIASQQAGLQGAQPPPCQAATAEMKKEIAALESKLSKLDRQTKALSTSISFDEDDFEKRLLKKIDEKLKKAAAPK